MIRNGTLFGLAVLAAVVVGCTKSEEPPQSAQTAKAGLMPGAHPGVESIYTADQTQTKLAGEREISYEPLDSFRGNDTPEPKKRPTAKVARHPRSKPKRADGKPGLFSRMKAGIAGTMEQAASGVAAAGAGAGAPPAPPAGQGDFDNADKEESEEDEDASEDDDENADEDADDLDDDEDDADDEDASDDEDVDDEEDAEDEEVDEE
ncbi:MAG: hypothetical protein ABII12_11670 [Planctomycetota bacterium]